MHQLEFSPSTLANLAGRKVIIPGADRGIGASTTALFNSKGANVVLVNLLSARDRGQTLTLLNYWYMVIIPALAGGSDPLICKDLYLYLISKPDFSTPSQRQALIRRIREALVKTICIVGVCRPIEAILAINEVERDEDKDHSVTREGWQCDEYNYNRGMGWMEKIYTRDTRGTMDLFRDHKDFEWMSRNITYGLYLSDRQVLDDPETEIIVLSGIMIQNLPKETHWHIRGSRRFGISREDVETIASTVHSIAGFLGLKLDKVPTVEDVEKDV
ncbi:DNA polymerase alpha subunit B [Fusarium oxysporum f. sp. pisi HDV247]|uniref:DNA polymerase alpha subunit B n=1 Tax=Fusarium oxysporum f. sp. pisi HDV247 TaxID=1080344 RepID=W9NHS2_FUSOX|nr:DNA polymerase alpha subunit B [Fusarium oxysporum f. sp. pisi HDV247]